MTAAIFGLVGVIVGGIINWAASSLAERRRDRREARAAGRLLERELRAVLPAVREWIVHADSGEPPREAALRFPAWKQYHHVAARALPNPAWNLVSDAYLHLYPVRTSDRFSGQLDDSALESLRTAEHAVNEAIRRLATVAAADGIATPFPVRRGVGDADRDETAEGD